MSDAYTLWHCPFCGEGPGPTEKLIDHLRERHPPEPYTVHSDAPKQSHAISRAVVLVKALTSVYLEAPAANLHRSPVRKSILSWAQGLKVPGTGGPEAWRPLGGNSPTRRKRVTCPGCKAEGVVVGYTRERSRVCMACKSVVVA